MAFDSNSTWDYFSHASFLSVFCISVSDGESYPVQSVHGWDDGRRDGIG